MCEFTVLRKTGSEIEKIGEDIIFFQYDSQGKTHLSDILGRSKVSAPNAFIREINMLENRHDITLIESETVPYFVRFLEALQSDSEDVKLQRAEELILEIKKQLA
ncbi:MAG: CooT family nickel-binding protein [Promethearchaeota archaeon]|nr:MAG: CooT family nickel-binding protein [Candidatus Lokiarchaeota archaeon]